MTSSPPTSAIPVAPTRVVVLGGGTAGWMTAAALSGIAGAAVVVELVESREIGIVGVGEATLPHLRAFIERLGIDEAEFMAQTEATYKLGIAFCDFGEIGERYIHPFGTYGRSLAGVGFHHYWLRMRNSAGPLEAFSFAVRAAEANRFAHPGGDNDPVASFGYAYQFDATRFAPFLRARAEAAGVKRTEGRVVSVVRDHLSGDVAALTLEDGSRVEGDIFIDCSGFPALLIGEMAPWEDWSRWLPCDRAVAAPCVSPPGPTEPYTRAHAMTAGWRWRIPLRHRVGNGYVYSSAHLSDDDAVDSLLSTLDGAPLADPRLLRFKAGRRERSWVGNVIAIGLASGFLEPLESTSIYLVQAAITSLLEHFPAPGEIVDVDRESFNTEIDYEYDRIRDFLILHYHATRRNDAPFWDHVRTMSVPSSLDDKLHLWRQCAQIASYERGLFLEPSWIAVLIGQGIIPTGYDPRADIPLENRLAGALAGLERHIAHRVAALPSHDAALTPRAA